MSSDRRSQSSQWAWRGPNLSEFIGQARSFFGGTTGLSQNISEAHRALHGDLTREPLTPRSVDRLVDAENHFALRGFGRSAQDWAAWAFTPLRRPVAHWVARQTVVHELGIDSENEYAARQRVIEERRKWSEW